MKNTINQMSKNKILVIDDEPNVCSFLAEYLVYKGFETRISQSGFKALQLIEAEDFDLILLDLIMPGMSGIEFLEIMKEMDRKIPVIIVTGLRDKNVANDTMEKGAVDFIPKPIDLDCLEQSLIINIKNLK
jgi:DNA-binding NtrC family response regulator